MRKIAVVVCHVVLLLGFAEVVVALPIGFGTHQGDLDYQEVEGPHFRVFHDARVPHEGAMTVNALEAVRPTMERWLGVEPRERPLAVVSSAVTENASFANFVTDVIELQTLGQGHRDLFWHEYVHATMYRHLHNFLGPTGSILHLLWMPAWFIEGLAESLSVSVGSDTQASIERYQALTNTWPSYDRLHSLYGGSGFFLQGYSTSGAFVAWILKQGRGKYLETLLKDFYGYTLPQYLPWAINPFSDFMPLDEALRDFLKKDGASLYTAYKNAAQKYWRSHRRGPFFVGQGGARMKVSGLPSIATDGRHAYLVMGDADGQRRRMRLIFHDASGWMIDAKPTGVVMPERASSVHYSRPGLQLGVSSDKDIKTGRFKNRVVLVTPPADPSEEPTETTLVAVRGEVQSFYETPSKVMWLEQDLETTRLCQIDKELLKKPHTLHPSQVRCPLRATLPRTIEVLGERRGDFPALGMVPPSPRSERLTVELWLAVREQTLVGDRVQVVAWDTNRDEGRTLAYDAGGQPLAMAEAGERLWMLVGEHNRRSLRQVSTDGACIGQFDFEDYPLRLAGLNDGSLVLGLYEGGMRSLLRLQPSQITLQACRQSEGHTSPLLWAMRHEKIGLSAALQAANLWSEGTYARGREPLALAMKNAMLMASPLDRAGPSAATPAVTAEDSKPASWSPRPVFAVPWIGADDALGSQFGLLSVPLMDLRQNETLRLTMLYGVASHYPNTEVTLESTRYWPTLTTSVYRRQVWDGTWYNMDLNAFDALFLDEKGVRFEAAYPFYFWDSSLSLGLGMRLGHLSPFIGGLEVVDGTISEPYLNLDYQHRLGRFFLSLGLRVKGAPAALNRRFDYYSVGGNATLSFGLPVVPSSLSLGVESSMTRGKAGKMPNLKEYYQALKTFVPGSGGGYNKNSKRLSGSGRLFTTLYGDTQSRAKVNWTMPLIADVDKQLMFFYFESLNLSAFYNYGGAWFTGDAYTPYLIKAHGYNLDLLFENKGVKLNASLGTGQVIGNDFETYVTFGFDAIL